MNFGMNKPSVLILAATIFIALTVIIAMCRAYVVKEYTISTSVSDDAAWQLIKKHCQPCHSRTPRSPLFDSAPSGFILDDIGQAKNNKARIYHRAITLNDMPFKNLSNMSNEERALLKLWLTQVSSKIKPTHTH